MSSKIDDLRFEVTGEPLTSSERFETPRGKKRQGKGAKSRQQQKYRERINKQTVAAFHQQLRERLKLTDEPEMDKLKDVVSRINLVVQPQAIPLSVTTRGIGFTTALFYDRAVTTWNLSQISAIATIHQLYRVALFLCHYKVYLAQQCQVELSTDCQVFERFELTDRIRETLSAVTVIPSSLALVLNNIGKVQTKNKLYFMGYANPPEAPADMLHYRAVTVRPDNIRATLEFLSNADIPQDTIDQYLRYNSIPGLAIVGGRLVNIEDVWPHDYGANDLSSDVAAFNNLMTRIQGRLPKHSFYEVKWDGLADSAGLWSSELVEAKLASRMKVNPVLEPQPTKRRRIGTGEMVDCPGPPRVDYLYQSSVIHDQNTEFWSPDETSVEHAVVGTASFVGEACFLHTRYRLSSGFVSSVHPVQTLRSLITAPR